MSTEIVWQSDDLSPEVLKNMLLERNRRWMQVKDGTNDMNGALRTVVLSCIDSRVPVEKIFQAKPGELLVLKNAGNLVFEDVLRSALAATLELKAKNIIIMGHTMCGMGIRDNPEKLNHLGTKVTPALKERIEQSKQGNVLDYFGFFDGGKWTENAITQAEKLRGYLNEYLEEGDRPNIMTAVYELTTGQVTFVD